MQKKAKAGASSSCLHSRAFDSGVLPALIYLPKPGKLVEVNLAACTLFNQTSEEILIKKCVELFGTQRTLFRKMQKEVLATGVSILELQFKNKDGNSFNGVLNASSFYGEKGKQYVKLIIVPTPTLSTAEHSSLPVKKRKVAPPSANSSSDDQFLTPAEWLKFIATTSYDVMWDWDIQNKTIYIGESIFNVLGYKIRNNQLPFKLFIKHILPADKTRTQQKLDAFLLSKELFWKDSFTLIKSDGHIASTMARGSIVRDDTGKAIRMIGALQDLSKLKELERKLKQQSTTHKASSQTQKEQQLLLEERLAEEISNKEKAITSAVVDAQELQRSELGRELHDNVNQLLGASKLYLDMARTEQGDISVYLKRSEEYTTTAIEAIRGLSKDLTTTILSEFGLSEAIDKLVTDTMQTLPLHIHYIIDEQSEAFLNLNFKLNIYRIIQEQLNNIVKYANASEVNIRISKNNFVIMLSITDDGIGFNVNKHRNGIGLSNIRNRSALFNGAVTITSQPGAGCTIKVLFPVNVA